jgi:D-methionine transport system substrate-binding protein
VEVVTSSDYILPNLALASGDLDANLYQHVQFMQQFNRDHSTRSVAVARVHLAPMALYPGRSKSLASLPDRAILGVPNDPVNLGRSLLLLQTAQLLRLDAKAGATATLHDIASNLRQLQFRELEAAQLPRSQPDVDAAVVNGNYALDSASIHSRRVGPRGTRFAVCQCSLRQLRQGKRPARACIGARIDQPANTALH